MDSIYLTKNPHIWVFVTYIKNSNGKQVGFIKRDIANDTCKLTEIDIWLY